MSSTIQLYLLKDKPIKFHWQDTIHFYNGIENWDRDLDKFSNHSVPIRLFVGGQRTPEDLETCRKLERDVNYAHSLNESKAGIDDVSDVWKLKANIHTFDNDSGKGKSIYWFKLEGMLLDLLFKQCEGRNGKLNVRIKHFEHIKRRNSKCTEWTAEETDVDSWRSGHFSEFHLKQVAAYNLPRNVQVKPEEENSPLSCLVTIELLLDTNYSGGHGRDLELEELLKMTQKIKLDDSTSDTVIVAENGAEIKCHRNFLFAHSSVLRTMLEGPFKEGVSGRIEMSDMSEDGVRAFLHYLYSLDIPAETLSPEVAFELLQASDKYDIPSLLIRMERLFLAKREDWFTVDVALDVYLLSRMVDRLRFALKMKAFHVLKGKCLELDESEKFNQLFKENPDAAKDLSLLSFYIRN